MKSLRIVLDYFGESRWRHWPGLAFYFFGLALYRGTGLRLFQKRLLRFDGFSVLADAGGMSGLFFCTKSSSRKCTVCPPWRAARP